MGARDKLRDAGRAARKLEERGIGGIDRDRRRAPIASTRRRALDQVGQRHRSRPAPRPRRCDVSGTDAAPAMRATMAVKSKSRCRSGVTRRDRLAELHELADLAKAMARKRRDRNGADLLQREIEDRRTQPRSAAERTTRSSGFKPRSSRLSARLVEAGRARRTVNERSPSMIATRGPECVRRPPRIPRAAIDPASSRWRDSARRIGRKGNDAFQHIGLVRWTTGEAAVDDDDFAVDELIGIDQRRSLRQRRRR